MALAAKARSSQLMMAAQLLAAGWVASVAAWRWISADVRELYYGGVDLVLASAFFAMSRGRWFPAPLFFLHAVLVLYNAYAFFIAAPTPWVSVFINRFYELALFYVSGCAIYRITRLRQKERARRRQRAPIHFRSDAAR